VSTDNCEKPSGSPIYLIEKGKYKKYIFKVTYQLPGSGHIESDQNVHTIYENEVDRLAQSILKNGFWLGDLSHKRAYYPGRCVKCVEVMVVPEDTDESGAESA
jgi:hypothetical protein